MEEWKKIHRFNHTIGTSTYLQGMMPKEAFEAAVKITNSEVNELKEVLASAYEGKNHLSVDDTVNALDALADIVTTCHQFAFKLGFILEDVLEIVNRSQLTKLVNGVAIWNNPDETGQLPRPDEPVGKFLKGPNYVAPEAEIRKLVLRMFESHQEWKSLQASKPEPSEEEEDGYD